MLLPRPEIRMATRLGSRIVRRGRAFTCDRAPAHALLDPPDLEHGLAGAFEQRCDLRRQFGRNDHRHADAAVESPHHFFGGDLSTGLKHHEYPWQVPALSFYDGMRAGR